MKLLRHVRSIRRVISLIQNWHVYYLDKLGLFGKQRLITIQLRDGLKFRIHSGNSDINSFAEIFLTDHYRRLLGQIDPDLDFVDMGAHVGIVSIAVASKLGRGRVYAFEPNPVVHKLLQENIGINNLGSKVTAYALCVAREKGNQSMWFKDLHWGGSYIGARHEQDEARTELEVSCIGLGDVLELTNSDHVGWMKIDCEGAETEILAGAKKANFLRIDNVLLEWHEPYSSPDELKTVLEQCGYRVTKSKDFGALLASR